MVMALAPRQKSNSGSEPSPAGDREAPATPGMAASPGKAEDTRSPVRGNIRTAVTRLIDVIGEETHALRSGEAVDLRAFNERKSLGLIELNRVLRLLENAPPDNATLGLLQQLNETLNTNRYVLTVHLEAVREVAGIISQSIRDEESDGTYTLAFRSKGQTP